MLVVSHVQRFENQQTSAFSKGFRVLAERS
jgi:hypothetical protein